MVLERSKWVLYVLLFTLSVCLCPVSVMAGGEQLIIPTEEGTHGSISVQLQDTEKNNPKEHVRLALTKVADVIDGEFVLCEGFSFLDVDLNRITNANEAERAVDQLMKYVTSEKEMLTDDNGYASIEELSIGVYILYVTDRAEYANITPCLISIPSYNEYAGVMEYEVNVVPKYTLLKPGQITTSMPEDISEFLNGSFQTGIEDHAMEYALIALFLFGGAIVMIMRCRRKQALHK